MDTLLRIVFVLLAATLIAALVWGIPKSIARSDKAEALALEMGCVCLGHPRDLNSVFFFDCDGTIVMKRVK